MSIDEEIKNFQSYFRIMYVSKVIYAMKFGIFLLPL